MAVRSTQAVLFALSATNLAYTRASQIVIAAIARPNPRARASQLSLDALVIPLVSARASWFNLEILVWSHEVTMPAVFPTLPGLTYSVIKRPKWFTGIGTSSSGREVRVGYAQSPLWEWDLTWDYLPDKITAAAATPSDLKQLMGFFLAQAGALSGFLFTDPDDYTVSGQILGSTDGIITNWTLVRTYGGSDGTGTEPIGYVDLSAPFHLYLDAVLVDPADYDVTTTHPVAQVVHFHTAPAADKVLSCTMTYWYYVRFKADSFDFEKFMDKFWSQRLITLASLRN